LITIGSFTQDAIGEAKRDGATPIELIDGEELLNKLKSLGLGVKTKRLEVEEIVVEKEWFAGI
jgi:restriction system protein